MELNDKQKRFCDEYIVDLNATQAAIRAGYSPKTATEQGYQLLQKPAVHEYIQERKKEIANKLQVSQEMVVEGYRRLAYYDARKFYDAKGDLIPIHDLDEETQFALAGFEIMEEKGGNGKGEQVLLGYTKKIKTCDRKGGLDGICRVMGYNAPIKNANTNKGGEDVVTPYTDSQVETLIKTLREVKTA